MNEKIEHLNENDVIQLDDQKNKLFMDSVTFVFDEFLSKLNRNFTNSYGSGALKWLDDGVEARVLSAGKSWRKGKIKLMIEFYPDEPESLLDEFRQQ